MKVVIGILVLFVGSFFAIHYGSSYIMGGIEGGMPDGGAGKFADYHEGNKVTKYFQGRKNKRTQPNYIPGGGKKQNAGYTAPKGKKQGSVTSNPYAND